MNNLIILDEKEKEEKKSINVTHMKYRMMWLYSIFGFGLYNCYTNSLYQPIVYNPYSLISINCYIFVTYLFWDTWKMMVDKRLFRKELLIHHSVCIYISLCLTNKTSLSGNWCFITECISLMNYYFRDPKDANYLKMYRLFCIFFIRMPIWFLLLNYNYYHIEKYLKPELSNFVHTQLYGIYFFIIYDLFLIHGNMKFIDTNKKNLKIE